MKGSPREAECGRCRQRRPCFPAKPEWGKVPPLLCARDWNLYATARAESSYVDFDDAFDNASDGELERLAFGTAHPGDGR